MTNHEVIPNNDETSPYFSGSKNSQVKSQNYYKRYFHKKLPVVLSSDDTLVYPVVTQGSAGLTESVL